MLWKNIKQNQEESVTKPTGVCATCCLLAFLQASYLPYNFTRIQRRISISRSPFHNSYTLGVVWVLPGRCSYNRCGTLNEWEPCRTNYQASRCEHVLGTRVHCLILASGQVYSKMKVTVHQLFPDLYRGATQSQWCCAETLISFPSINFVSS